MKNTLYTGDNLYFLHRFNSESVDLIYLDPPFNSKRFYAAPVGSKAAGSSFKDMWTWQDIDEQLLDNLFMHYPFLVKYIQSIGGVHGKAMMSYCLYMAQRLIEMHRVLKETGTLYIHIDPTASHYLKLILDRIFGEKNFLNEVIWGYSTSGRSPKGKRKKWARKHDVLLWYAKNAKKVEADCSLPCSPEYIASHYRQVDAKGRKCRIRVDHGKERIYYPDEGINGNDWWVDIPYVNSQAKERTGYPTQKPLDLMRRIIATATKEGDVVLDPFCGCATTCVAAQQLNRKWIGIDIEKQAVKVLVERLSDDAKMFSDFIHTTELPNRTDLKIVAPTSGAIRDALYKEQKGTCNGCGTEFEPRHFHVDHIIPKSKGGTDTSENYQLLCGSCNTIKGNRPMEYLRMRIEQINKKLEREITFGR